MKLFLNTLAIFLILSLSSKCFGQCERCTTLFEQMKDDKLFTSFIAINESIVNLYIDNANKAPRSINLREQDSLYMRDTSITIEEKYDTLNYKGLKVIKELNQQAIETLGKLEDTYPLLKDLTDDEYKIFIKMATEYYNSLKKQ